MRAHWYKISTWYCVLCGHEDTYRERMFTPRPEDHNQRRTLHETACGHHFL
jgi:hypothetical protein